MSLISNEDFFDTNGDETLSLQLRNILTKKPEFRDQTDIEFVANHICNLKYFKSIVYDTEERLEFAKECAKHLKYKLYPKGSEVFRRGDKGQNFYIILKGDAVIFSPKDDEEIERDLKNEDKIKAFNKYKEYISHNLTQNTYQSLGSSNSLTTFNTRVRKPTQFAQQKVAHILLSGEFTALDAKIKEDLTSEEKLLFLNDSKPETAPYFIKGTAIYKKILSLKDGDSFGELALIFNQPRLASVIAAEDLHLVCMKGSEYKEVFVSQIRNVLDKVKFFQGIFKDVPQIEIEKFCYLLEEKSFKFNDMICREGDHCRGIYFIKQGEVQLAKNGNSDNKNSMKRSSLIQKRIVAGSLLSGKFFGDFETIMNSKMNYTALCASTTQIYKLKKNHFGLIEKQFPLITKTLVKLAHQNNIERKVAIHRNEKVQSKTLPFVNGGSSQAVSEKLTEEAKNVEKKLRSVYRKTSEVMPLHFKSKYETIVLKDEDEDEKETTDVNYLTDRKTQSVASLQNFQPHLAIRDLHQNTPISFDGTKSSIGEISTPSNKNKEGNSGFSIKPSKSKFPVSSVDVSDGKSSPRTPTSLSLSPHLKLPKINSPKSSFSALTQDKKDDGGFTSIVSRLKTNASYIAKIRDSESSTPSNFVNVCSPKNDQSQKNKTVESIFATAVQVLSQRKSPEPKKVLDSEENIVKNIQTPSKPSVKTLDFLSKNKKSPKNLMGKKVKPLIPTKRNSEQRVKIQTVLIKKKSNSFLNTLTIQKKTIAQLQNITDSNQLQIENGSPNVINKKRQLRVSAVNLKIFV